MSTITKASYERLAAECAEWHKRAVSAESQLESLEMEAELAGYKERILQLEAKCERLREALHQAQNLIAAGRDANFNEVGECEDDDWLARIDKWLNQALAQEPPAAGCAHIWFDVRHAVIEEGEVCVKCHAVRGAKEPT